MKKLLFPLLLISIVLTAQKKEHLRPLIKTDTTKRFNTEKLAGSFELKQGQQPALYKMLIKKPDDTITYLALKEPSKDYSKYKILNAVTPDKLPGAPKKPIASK